MLGAPAEATEKKPLTLTRHGPIGRGRIEMNGRQTLKKVKKVGKASRKGAVAVKKVVPA